MSKKTDTKKSIHIQGLSDEQMRIIDDITFTLLKKGFISKPSRAAAVLTLIEKYYQANVKNE